MAQDKEQGRSTNETPTSRRAIDILARNPDFLFDDLSIDRFFYQGDPFLTHFFSDFSVQSGPIETFFLKDGKYALDAELIKNPAIRHEVIEYLKQEALHGAIHNRFNEMLKLRGYPVDWAQDMVRHRLERIDGDRHRMLRGAMVVAGEHVLGEVFELALNKQEFTEGLDPAFRKLLCWHACEEVEHKSVAIDAYHDIFGRNLRSWLMRVRGLCEFLWVVLPAGFRIQAAFRKVDGTKMGLRGWMRLLRFYLVKPGMFWRLTRGLLAFLNPWFHPWRYRDNARQLEAWRAEWIDEDWNIRKSR